MDKYLTLSLVLGAITANHGSALPTMPWDDEDISVMCLISTDYYNKVSGESSLYRLQESGTEYWMNETVSYHQLHFTIKETLCQKPEEEVTEDCAFLEDGLVKSCTASIMVEDDRDIIVVTCDNVIQKSRVRRSRNGGRGNGGRGNGGRGNGGRGNGGRGNGGSRGGRAGSGSSIAGGGGSRGNSRHA